MGIYDIDGNQISGSSEITDEDIKRAYISAVASGALNPGSVIGATLAYNIAKASWIANGETQYAAMLATYKNLPNDSIPFFISTDQHGAGLEWNRWANNMDVDGMEYANLNLGDTINWTVFREFDALIPRVKQIKNYISVPGNHDYQRNDVHTDYNMTPYEAFKAFPSTRDRKILDRNSDTYVVIDNRHDVKFIAADNYWLDANGGPRNDTITGSFCDALINEMSLDDYDIVYLQHWHPFALATELYNRSGTTGSGFQPGGSHEVRTILSARKAKQQGTVVDADGVTHAYDFRNMEHELLCSLHGHEHAEWYAYLDGVLCYMADAIIARECVCFGIINRKDRLLHIWRWRYDEVFDEFTVSLEND